ncbi:hypothetical protein GLAREA_05941 [Glarea lozoyensis ATCC 20868]|uniref:Concanavalin A-like lectins/glucanase n=1 Tax=Glarea lozoyensis (strain ATCC 20868 / MF5171) TaxID=1116229 RepID=S3D709_GLAL2|nr:uncharacterized protein GLAREA_05941 [Glarea lozoyensis ATCC 20868]EPE32929.1 hypothetical protein GLAREA_05941 [Glarea lozoyensis ATCC 20868]
MNLLNILLFVVGVSSAPTWQSQSDAAVSSNVFWFLPNAPITRYQVTVVVPAVSPGKGLHGVWPGLQNQAGSFVYQSVLADSNSPGAWQFWVEYCCNPDYKAQAIKVYPGDAITSTFTTDGAGLWTDSWSLTPGPQGLSAGQTAQSGSTSQNFADRGALIRGLLAIELQQNGAWDFGAVQWSNIAITASTTAPWCATGSSYAVSPNFQYSISAGTQSTNGGSTTCTFPNVRFNGP